MVEHLSCRAPYPARAGRDVRRRRARGGQAERRSAGRLRARRPPRCAARRAVAARSRRSAPRACRDLDPRSRGRGGAAQAAGGGGDRLRRPRAGRSGAVRLARGPRAPRRRLDAASRRDVPDVLAGVLPDGAVGRELPGPGHVQDRHPRPALGVAVRPVDLVLAGEYAAKSASTRYGSPPFRSESTTGRNSAGSLRREHAGRRARRARPCRRRSLAVHTPRDRTRASASACDLARR